MPRAVVFLDIDGTLLNEEYKCNDLEITSLITSMQEKDIVFCLNSNRSIEDLLPVAQRFNISGLLIGENGIFAYNAKQKTTEYLVSPSHLAKFAENKRSYEDTLRETLETLYGNIDWYNVDTVDILTHRPKYKDLPSGSIVALNNVYRRYTASTHILRWENGKLIPFSKADLQQIVQLVKDATSEQKGVDITFSETFSNVLTTPSEVSKRRAVKKIIKDKGYLSAKLYAVGDELDDFKMIEGLGTFMTVSNASDETKATSSKVALNPQAKGTRELLEVIRDELTSKR